MREPIKDRIRLEHIAEAANNISRYTSGKTYDDLLADDMMCYAVVYNILAIGEATYHRSSLRPPLIRALCRLQAV